METTIRKLRWWQFGTFNVLNGMLLVAVFFAGYTLAPMSNERKPAEESRPGSALHNPSWDAPPPPPPVVDPAA